MTKEQLKTLHTLLEELELDEGICYRTRSACSPACPLWMRGAFGNDVCLANVLARKVKLLTYNKRLHEKKERKDDRE